MINNIAKFIDDCEQNLSQKFKEVNEIALFNQKKVLEAFRKNNISQRHLYGKRYRIAINSVRYRCFERCVVWYIKTGRLFVFN